MKQNKLSPTILQDERYIEIAQIMNALKGADDLVMSTMRVVFPEWKRGIFPLYRSIDRFVTKKADYSAHCFMCGVETGKYAKLVKTKSNGYQSVCKKDYDRLQRFHKDYYDVAFVMTHLDQFE